MGTNERTPRWIERLATFCQALARLTAVIELARQKPLDEFERDSLIKRFEFCYEMAWKTMMSYEKDNGIVSIVGSKDVVRHAVKLNLTDNGEAWMEMIDARNKTSHVYDEEMAADIIDEITHTFHPLLEEMATRLTQISKQQQCTD